MAADDEDRPDIGHTGARFGGSRTGRKADPAPADAVTEPEPDDEWPAIGMTGARFGGAPRRRRRPRDRAPAPPAPTPPPVAAPAVPPAVHWPLSQAAEPEPEPAAADLTVSVRVRPYVFTGGRTRAHIELELETLVSVGPRPAAEHWAVVALCRHPISVAEVAALMNVPIGVARVVVGDLAAQGALIVHANAIQDVPDQAFLERVLTGLRRL